jgi:hypothetical protein
MTLLDGAGCINRLCVEPDRAIKAAEGGVSGTGGCFGARKPLNILRDQWCPTVWETTPRAVVIGSQFAVCDQPLAFQTLRNPNAGAW